MGSIRLPPNASMSPSNAYSVEMARLVWVALVCWPTPFHMNMLTGRLPLRTRAASRTLSAGTRVTLSDRSGAWVEASRASAAKAGSHEIVPPSFAGTPKRPSSAGRTQAASPAPTSGASFTPGPLAAAGWRPSASKALACGS